ncbi:uncharacterized protein LOC127102745 [Lathyrus oleraceus]|uniref:uncharacterized protein LOC127102745 n=1 Tax=Pisum sativum TaxID=3888 RepID=UPI0021CFC861|nr:uncharacterized protein LOC127102745 [Pisum sativum]
MVEKEQLYISFPPYNPLDITKMPSYAKFLKKIIPNKRKLDDYSIVALTEECSAIIQNNMPHKLKVIRSFSIPRVIVKYVIDKALYDLGAILADYSIKYSVGILEDIPVRIGQLYIHIDFVVMDIKEESNIPSLLGIPFLATAGAIIDVKRGKITFEVGGVKIEFILCKFLKD